MDIKTFTGVIRFQAHDDNGDAAGSVEIAPYGDAWIMFSLYVPPVHRGAGVGRKLVDSVLEFAGDRTVYLEPKPWADGGMSQLELVAWYMRLGFERTEQTGLYGHFARKLAEAC